MDKFGMREWVASLEEVVDNKLKKWRKIPKVENGESVQLAWQWEQTRISMNVFWEDHKETVNLFYTSPRIDHSYRWHALSDQTFNRIMDRVGNLAQVTMYPTIDSLELNG